MNSDLLYFEVLRNFLDDVVISGIVEFHTLNPIDAWKFISCHMHLFSCNYFVNLP
jgi:hypothetical protein